MRDIVAAVLADHEPGGNTEHDISCFPCDESRWPQGWGNSISRHDPGTWSEHFLALLDERLTARMANAAPPALDVAAPTPQTHAEHFCERCGGPNLMWWHAPSPLWNTVMRDSEGLEKFGVVCPRCFGELAREQGVADFFCLTTHDPLVPLPSVFGDGRVWDAAKCMWVEAKEPDR